VTTVPLAGGPPETVTTCALCSFVYAPGGDSCRERGCPIAIGACATRHCPRCGYTTPDEQKSASLRFVRWLLQKSPRAVAGTLAEMPAGSSGVVERIEGDPGLQARLTAQGLAPGLTVHVLQRIPTYVIEAGETTIALERRVAEAVVMRRG
jgi:Fe2+ transport system protein FeoA